MSGHAVSDDELEQLLRTGDIGALESLFERHRNRLWKVIDFRLSPTVRQRADPDDLLQETFAAAQARLPHFVRSPLPSSFLWLRLIALQVLAEHYRRHAGPQRDAHRDVALDGGRDTSAALVRGLATSATSPSGAAMRRETLEQIEKALGQLEALDQDILALRHFEELSNSEVAKVLNIQEKTASIRYIRALRRLKDVLATIPGFFENRSAGEGGNRG
jgi:RNA polymerase sigma-70 factor (ECF subfamily)